jgi:small conductance mechanosensitive channel
MGTLSSDLLNPATVEGALVYAFLFVCAAIVGGVLIRRASRRLIATTDDELRKGRIRFASQLARVAFYVVIIIIYAHLIPALRAAGTALLASASVVSVVLGLAAQSTLGNLIAGIAITLYRPFQVGDRLELPAPGGVDTAVVEQLNLGHTVLRTYDNRRLVVPNGVMIGQTVINLSSEDPKVQAIVPVSISYSADIDAARRLLIDAAHQHPGVLEIDSCRVVALEASSVTLELRAWCQDAATAKSTEYELFETAIGLFRDNGIEIPFPTMNVNIFGNSHKTPVASVKG